MLQTKSTHVKLLPEPKYETAIKDATEHTERYRQIRSNQLKLQWELKSQTINEVDTFCVVKDLGRFMTRNVSSFTMLASELRAVIFQHKIFQTTKFRNYRLWNIEKCWKSPPFGLVKSLSIGKSLFQKTKEGQNGAEICDFENREEATIRDIFIANILEDKIQRKIIRDPVEPERALSIAVILEMGHQNQQWISSNNNTVVNVVHQFTQFWGANARKNQQNRNTFNRESTGLCRGCGQNWTRTHSQVCPVLGKKRNHCGLQLICKSMSEKHVKSKNPQENKRINNVENSVNTEQSDNQNVNFINYNEQNNSQYDSSDENCIAMIEQINQTPIALQNMTITIGNTYCRLLLNSGSAFTIKSMSLAKQIKFNCSQANGQRKNHSNIYLFQTLL